MKQKNLLRTVIDSSAIQQKTLALHFGDLFPQYVFSKIKRLSEAVYLLTAHLKDSEPIKKELRTSAIETLKLSVINEDTAGVEKLVVLKNVYTSLISMVSILEVAAVSEIISLANYYIIRREIESLLGSIYDKIKDKIPSSAKIDPDFFQINLKDNKSVSDVSIKDKKSVYPTEDNDFGEGEFVEEVSVSVEEEEFKSARTVQDKKIKHQSDSTGASILRTDERLKRERTILSFFGSGLKLTVSDVHRLLPNYTEKTIQRELVRLVGIGALSKVGKRRWTRYYRPI